MKNGRLNVHDIYLDENQFDDECLPSLCSLIVGRKDIKNVFLSGNRITDSGVKVFPEFLTGNTSLLHFDLSNNKGITDASFEILLRIAASSKLKKLYVSGTSMTGQNKNDMTNITNLSPERRMSSVHKFIKPKSILKKPSSASETPIQSQLQPVRVQLQTSTPVSLENQLIQEKRGSEIEKSHSISKREMLQILFSFPKNEGSQTWRSLQSALEISIYPGLSSFFELKD